MTFHIEHIHAIQHIRDDSLANLCLACPHCNLHKGPNLTTLDAETRQLIPLFHARRHAWEEHFRLQVATIEGVTPIGVATARLLNMNEADQIEIRRALILRNEF